MKTRDSNIELLRLLLMAMIVLWHFFVHGMDIRSIASGSFIWTGKEVSILFITLICFPMNCFIFISGYYGARLKSSTFVAFFMQTLFYAFLTLVMSFFIYGREISKIDLFASINPVGGGLWWFFTDYFLLMSFAPLLNKGVDLLEKATFKKILLLGYGSYIFWIFMWNGDYSFYSFIWVYLLGRYFSKYPVVFLEKRGRLFLALSVVILLMINMIGIYQNKGGLIWRNLNQQNPLIIVATISFFYTFKRFSIKSNVINKLAGGVFAVYLFTDSPYLQGYINESMITFSGGNIVLLISFAILLTIGIASFELLRKKAFGKTELMLSRLLQKIESKF